MAARAARSPLSRLGLVASVRARLALWHAAVLALFLLVFAAGSYSVLEQATGERIDERLEETANAFAGALLLEHASSPVDFERSEAVREFRFKELRIVVYDPDGHIVAVAGQSGPRPALDSIGPSPILDRRFLSSVSRAGPTYATIDLPGPDERVYILPAQLGEHAYLVAVMQSLAGQHLVLQKTLDAYLIGIPVALLLAWVAGYALARRSLRPVVEMSRRAARMSVSTLHERLPVVNERDELGQLARVFNDLLSRLDDAFEQQRRFMADASHELRTPVAIMRAEADVALSRAERSPDEYRDALATVRAEGRRLTTIVDDLFLLARADAGQQPVAHRALYFDELITECVRAVRTLAANRGLTLESHVDDDVSVRGDEALLRRLVLNLLDNAIKYTPPGGHVCVRLERDTTCCRLTVSDTGPGIPAEAQPRIFERFYRADTARSREFGGEGSGAGLGLAIARWVAEAHGAHLDLVRSDGTGTSFLLQLALDREET